MEMAPTLVTQLAKYGISYDIIPHSYSIFSLNTANAIHISGSKMVKSVILEDDAGYVMALVPANRHVKINQLNKVLHRNMGLATESELIELFDDCDPGAIPPVGEAYKMETIVDYILDDCKDVYIESGNHEELLHLSGSDFRKLMKNSHHANICMH